jgi:branched-chain amino acid transport system ATP-binding protein
LEETKELLRINDISANYGPIGALDGISLNVGRGEINVVLGTNGAGKSTLLWTIMGLLHPTEGSILFNKVPIHRMPTEKIVRLGICLVPEGRRIFPELTVLENGSLHQKRQIGYQKRY